MTSVNNFTVTKVRKKVPGIKKSNVKILIARENQLDVWEYRTSRYFSMTEPCGSGKSVSIQFIALHNLLTNPNMKVVIAIPQTMIMKTFRKAKLQLPGGDIHTFEVGVNLCKNTKGSKIKSLLDFIHTTNFGSKLSDRIVLTTHMALSRLFHDNINEDFKDTIFFIDEAHHILYPQFGVSETTNRIGGLVKYIMEKDDPSTKIWFSTATFFRTDKFMIIPPEQSEKFINYRLTLDVYWDKYIRHIETFSHDFVIYKDRDVFTGIKEIIRKCGKIKTIVYCPYIGDLVNGLGKMRYMQLIKESILEVWPECRILDLVDIEDRDARKQTLPPSQSELPFRFATFQANHRQMGY